MWLPPEERELESLARDVLRGGLSESTTTERDRDIRWRGLADLGWAGLCVPEERGGAGLSLSETGTVLKELGRVLAPDPVLSSAVMATVLLDRVPATPASLHWRDDLISGRARCATDIGANEPSLRIVERNGDTILQGAAEHVLDGLQASAFVVGALDADGDLALVLVDASAPGLSRVALSPLDQSRNIANITFKDTPLHSEHVLARGEAARLALSFGLAWARFALACDSLGLAERMLEMTTDYVRARVQFTRPIGSFQAVKHGCTDMLVEVEVARAAVMNCPDPLRDVRGFINGASVARVLACEAAATVCASAIQLHGGIGYTWEYPAHRYLKRARLNLELVTSARHDLIDVFDRAIAPRIPALSLRE